MKAQGTDRRQATVDLALAVGVVLASLVCTPTLTPVFRRLSGLTFVLALAAFQFSAEGLVPLILIAARRERFADYGFQWQKIGNSMGLALLLVIAYDLALSLHAGTWIWVPLRRHNAVRNALADGFPLSIGGLVIVVAIWGFLEAFFGVFFARKLNQLLGREGNGWLAPGCVRICLVQWCSPCGDRPGLLGLRN